MVFPHEYKNKTLVVKIEERDDPLSEIFSDEFFGELIRLNVHGARAVAFDLTGKQYFNSADLGVLIKIKDMLMDEGLELILINTSDKTRELLQMVGLIDFFHLVEREQDI
ncbi:MAG TPA: STAS domain-containing protein [Spirochaetota bacterium]|nr:STAS domain-containing protein [Spirochaetota bacterium]HNT11713.1 STAS domain-containing protein [Spirochaetota bacterium]HNV48902.1 STAS domain-containing protein [Spirochaetota bacterium]HPU90408.1 STAS domain-containing protein [Spirochaetota bacterium]